MPNTAMRDSSVWTAANILSFANLTCGVLCIMASAIGRFEIAAALVLLAAAFDYFDGKAARMSRAGTSGFGAQLDSLCDVVSFVVAPAMFAFMLGLRSPLWIVVLALYVIAGVFRLARHNVSATASAKPQKFFQGVPVTVGAIFPILWLACAAIGIPLFVWALLYPTHAVLMVSRIKIKKL